MLTPQWKQWLQPCEIVAYNRLWLKWKNAPCSYEFMPPTVKKDLQIATQMERCTASDCILYNSRKLYSSGTQCSIWLHGVTQKPLHDIMTALFLQTQRLQLSENSSSILNRNVVMYDHENKLFQIFVNIPLLNSPCVAPTICIDMHYDARAVISCL